LNVGGVHDGRHQQALRIDQDLPLLALDLFARVIPRPIDESPPCMGLQLSRPKALVLSAITVSEAEPASGREDRATALYPVGL
jgi:hypothetical protein